jgi:hypothetical protein
MVLNTLESKIVEWHYDRNLINGSTDIQQFEKLLEEVEELRLSLNSDLTPVDDIGDIIVVLINIATRHGLTLFDCLYHAYNDIKDRKGKMVDGIFVKERVDQSVGSGGQRTNIHDSFYQSGFEDGKKFKYRYTRVMGDVTPNLGPELANEYNKGYNAGIRHQHMRNR